ncbi:uncharacterized protein LOC21392487 isoform X1 [Morus notabilis]|uniref:uncharacterized protein LOC21392487 isoform X1 n=1 Tax=Morus notabilis TaxID=981085 RepID=UPI000CED14E7|nr:uncharacterized protein LOC21392487 isoform X1 [Morus notabilis]
MEAENFIVLLDSDDPACENGGGDNFDKEHIEVDSQGSSSKDKEDTLDNEDICHKSDIEDKNRIRLKEADPEKDLINGDSDMEIEDLNGVPVLTAAGYGLENNGIDSFSNDPRQAGSQSVTLADKDMKTTSENLVSNMDGAQREDGTWKLKAIQEKDLADNSSLLQVNVNLTDTAAVAEASKTTFGCEIGRVAVQDKISIRTKKREGYSISGVKRSRVMFEEQQPSVCVKFNFLTRSSKYKLEELMQQWSEWQAQHHSSSQDPPEALESGEETYFSALHIGLEKASSVPFWIDKQTGKQQNNELSPLDCNSVPLYDRGFALGLTSDGGSSNVEGGLEIVEDAVRCFNCGSYNHALKECPKPRDNVAVNNARKQLKSKRNQNPSSRNPTRYYQNSPAGKYDGLKPGTLDPETRKLLGLRELDPPPWLGRMREIGYPPGYLDPDEEDQPSGITIYADGEGNKAEQEDGEIIEADNREPPRKMTVEFPGINGPIPENADRRIWTAAPASSDIYRNRLLRRSNHSSEPTGRSHHREERWSREFRDDGPPGVDQGFSPAMSTYLPRYGSSYESSYNSHSPRLNPPFGRFESDRGRRSHIRDEDYGHGSFGSSHYSSHVSPKEYGSARYWVDESRNDYDFDYSTLSRERQDRYRHLSKR